LQCAIRAMRQPRHTEPKPKPKAFAVACAALELAARSFVLWANSLPGAAVGAVGFTADSIPTGPAPPPSVSPAVAERNLHVPAFSVTPAVAAFHLLLNCCLGRKLEVRCPMHAGDVRSVNDARFCGVVVTSVDGT
jgi:hypothetical protein